MVDDQKNRKHPTVMTDKLRTMLMKFADFDEDELEKNEARFKLKHVAKNTILLNVGNICKEFYFVKKGCLSNYFINKDGFVKTRLIILDGEAGTALTSFISQTPSIEFVEALEDSELLTISHLDFYDLVKREPKWQAFYQSFLEATHLYQSRKVEALMTLNATQRFQKLLKGNPVLIQRLSNKVLASFLDMREETLSRIKQR
jgi:CRP-like cAMP-binding protein